MAIAQPDNSNDLGSYSKGAMPAGYDSGKSPYQKQSDLGLTDKGTMGPGYAKGPMPAGYDSGKSTYQFQGAAGGGVGSPAAGSGNSPGAMAGPTPTPSGWRPIELDLPVPGGSPYHFDAQNQAGIQPAVQGYRTAVEAGVRGLIGQPLQQVEQQLGAGHPLLQQFFDYLRNLVEQRAGQGQPPPFHLPGGGPNGPIESGPNPNPPVAQPGPIPAPVTNPSQFPPAQRGFPDIDSLFNHLGQKRFAGQQ